MKAIKPMQLTRDYKIPVTKLKRKYASPEHVDQPIDRDTLVIAPNGKIIALFLKQVVEPSLCERAYKSWKIVKDLPSNRATAVGTLSLLRIKNDGKLGDRNGVAKRVLQILKKQGTRHGMLGYLDTTKDKSFDKTRLTRKHPKMLRRNKTLIELVDKLYKRYLRDIYAIQRTEIKKAPRCRLWHTAFSTIYLAKNFRTAYHTDHGNLRGVMTALLVMGSFTGGELVLPRWRIALVLRPGDLLFFDPQQLHGNLPFEGKRLSAAFFCAGRIAKCGKKGR